MRRIAVFVLLGAVTYLVSCSDDNNPVKSTTQPLFSVSLQDTNGDPVSGWEVGSINHMIEGVITDAKKPCPYTPISFTLAEATDWTLVIYDYNGDEVIAFFGSSEAGEQTISWNGTDVNGDPVPSGFYRYYLSAGDIEDEKWMVMEMGADLQSTILGELDSNGYFSTNNIALFPGLIANPPLEFYTDTVTVHLSDPNADPAELFTFVVKLNREGNKFSFVRDDSGITMLDEK
jgi:hypothetical protein